MFRLAAATTGKALGLWVAIVAGSIAGSAVADGVVGKMTLEPGPMDGPLSAGAAFLVVTALQALVLTALAVNARLRGGALLLFLFVVTYGAQTVLMQVETVFFGAQVGVPPALIQRLAVASAITALAAAGAAALLFRRTTTPAPAFEGLAWRLPAAALVYAVLYFAAGYCIAWQSPALRAFYDEGADIALMPLVALQLARGLAWSLLAWLMVRSLRGPRALKAALVGVAFAVLGAAQLLYPNPYLPWAVRLPHLVEIALANALFGAFATVLLRERSRPASP